MKVFGTVLVVLAVAMFAMLAPLASADTLNTADSFAVLGGAAVTNTGTTTINGNVGVSPGSSLTGGGLCPAAGCFDQTGGTIASASVAGQAQTDATNAYNTLALLPSPLSNHLTGTDLGGLTLTPGVYSFTSSAQLTGTLTLNAEGNPNAVWIFEIGSTLTTASGSSVVIENETSSGDNGLFWLVGSEATLGTTTSFLGNILASASITFDTGATDDCGRALAETGAVTLDTNTISIGCANVQGEGGSNGLAGGATTSTGGGGGTPAPEPGTLGLGLVGLSGLCFFSWRRHRLTARSVDFC